MRKILVVDDNNAFTDLVDMVFGSDYEVHKSNDGQEGMKLAEQVRPDVILLDVMMPKITGIEMLRLLQADPETRVIPVVILTATQFDPTTTDMFRREPNVSSFLRKPCGVDELRAEIEAAISKRGS